MIFHHLEKYLPLNVLSDCKVNIALHSVELILYFLHPFLLYIHFHIVDFFSLHINIGAFFLFQKIVIKKNCKNIKFYLN